MKNKIIILIVTMVIILYSSFAFSREKWDKTDKILLGTCLVTSMVDYGNTMHIARNPQDHFEYNPLLGTHPSPDKVRGAFLIGLISKIIIAELLPSKYRKIWLGGWTIASGTMVVINHEHGISFEW